MNENPLTDSTAFKLHRATVLVDRLADEYLVREHGIHYSAFVVLLMARVLGQTGAASQTAIAANLAVSRASITQRVAGLVQRGLLHVNSAPDDARANIVRLTPEGEELFDRAWRGLEEHRNGIDDGVDAEILAAQLDRLIANGMRIMGAS